MRHCMLMHALPVDVSGTGANVEYVAPAIADDWFKKIVVLDLTPSLCQVQMTPRPERANLRVSGCERV